jgi:transcriptional regulator with XRE-family HTH domain
MSHLPIPPAKFRNPVSVVQATITNIIASSINPIATANIADLPNNTDKETELNPPVDSAANSQQTNNNTTMPNSDLLSESDTDFIGVGVNVDKIVGSIVSRANKINNTKNDFTTHPKNNNTDIAQDDIKNTITNNSDKSNNSGNNNINGDSTNTESKLSSKRAALRLRVTSRDSHSSAATISSASASVCPDNSLDSSLPLLGSAVVEHVETPPQLHRIATVRAEQGISLSRAAKRMQIDISAAREQENETADLKLSQLYQWRNVLEVSAGELIIEPEEIPCNPIKNRCQLVRMMKTVRSIIVESKSEVVVILARQLEALLVDLMPELETIAAWPSVGQSREPHSPGIAATRCTGFGNVYSRRNVISDK